MTHLSKLAVVLLLVPLAVARAAEFAAQRDQVLALGKLTAPPLQHPVNGLAGDGDLKAIYFDALPWKGKPTKVFAWLGRPAPAEGRVPGVVLVHGGGGTAFKEWVKLWNANGFAAISIAVEGQTDEKGPAGGWRAHDWAGPRRDGIYGDTANPLEDQWMYHAVADTILANSLLRGLPDVDAERIGMMGISWGGVIASTVAGLDARFAFVIPVYGCGHLADAPNQYGRALGGNECYQQVWEPMLRLDRAKMPMLWFSWPGDEHFPLDCQARCYRAAPGPHLLALVPGMGHGHNPGWDRPEGYAFAQAVVKTGQPWCRQVSAGSISGNGMAVFASDVSLDGAVLVSTADGGFTGKRKWSESPARLSRDGANWRAEAPLPPGTTAWFINVRNGRVIASSDFQVVEKVGTSSSAKTAGGP